MGQHTWFNKSKELYLKSQEIYKKVDDAENGIIYLDNLELLQLISELDKIYEENDTEYHDLFRTNKRNEDGTYTDDVIFSKEECDKWIKDNNIIVTYPDELSKFWEEYPDGVIYFS